MTDNDPMGVRLFSLIIFVCLGQLYAAGTVRVTLGESDKVWECAEEPTVSGYFCLEGEDDYLIVRPLGGDDFMANGRWGERGERWYSVKKIEGDDGAPIYQSVQRIYFSAGEDLPEYYKTDLLNHYLKLKSDIVSLQTPLHDNMAPSPRYANFLQKRLQELEEEKGKIFAGLSKNKVKVSLDGGSEVNCQRGVPRNPSLRSSGKITDLCNVFSCGSDEEGRRRMLFFDPTGGPSEMLYAGGDGFYNGLEVTSVEIVGNETPLYLGRDFSFAPPSQLPEANMAPRNLLEQSDFFYKAQYSGYVQGLRNMGKQCREGVLGHFDRAHEGYQDKLIEAELIQYISSVENILQGHFIPTEQMPEGACYQNGVYYERGSYEYAENYRPSSQPGTISEEEVQKLFNEAMGMSDIAWDYRRDGCYARAHLMARRFEKRGIDVDKAWLKGNLFFGEDGNNIVGWNFHVAPMVHVKLNSGEIQKFVIDPSTFDRPVPVDLWARTISQNGKRGGDVLSFPRKF